MKITMKRWAALGAVLTLSLLLLAGCGSASSDAPPDTAASGTAAIESFKTIGDAPALDSTENQQYAMIDDYFIYVFSLDDTNYRVIALMPEEVSKAAWELDWGDEDHDAKLQELISPLEIIRYENLNDLIPAQEELDVYVGKTGQDLFDDGWYNSGWNLDTMEFWMNRGPFCYTVVFDGTVDNYEDFQDEDINTLVIKSITFDRLGDATDIELDDDGNLVE